MLKAAVDGGKTVATNLSAPFICQFFSDPQSKVIAVADYVFGNESEAEAWATKAGLEDRSPENAAIALSKLPKTGKGSRTVVITQGSKSVLVAQNGTLQSFPVPELVKEKIVDTNGAGDAFVGGFMSQLIQGQDLAKCVAAGNYAAQTILQVSGCSLSGKPTFGSPSLKLTYWPARGLMEAARLALAVAGKFAGQDYVDERVGAIPEAGTASNLGRMPYLSESGQDVGQSTGIYYYIGVKNGLFGSNSTEGSQILALLESLNEMKTAFRKVVPYGQQPSDENLNTWFNTGASDVIGAADRAGIQTRFAQWWMGRIEASLTGSGIFAVGSSISMADVFLYDTFAEFLPPEQRVEGYPDWKSEPFGSMARTNAALAKYPKISASISAVKANANAQKYWSSRPKPLY